MNRRLWYVLAVLCLVWSYGAVAQTPQLVMKMCPRYIAAVPTSSATLESPSAFYFEITGLPPNTVWDGMHMGFLEVGTTATRGSKWTGVTWISPSTVVKNFGSSDATGKLASRVYLRPPSSFFERVGLYRVRLRIGAVGVDTINFDAPESLTALSISPTAGDTTAGAIVYGYTDSVGVNLTQKIVVAYEKATDTIPLAAWLLYKTPTTPVETELYNTRTDTTLRRAGYFQLVVPANVAIGKLELRDTNNVVIRTQTSTLWKAGPKGSKTDLSAQQNIVLDVEAQPPALPATTELAQNYPNPFNPSTSITFSLAKASHVTLTVYDAIGRQVAVLAEGQYAAGRHTAQWNAAGRSSGVYFCRLQGEGFTRTRTMVLMR